MKNKRWLKQAKLRITKAFRRKKTDDAIGGKSPYVEPDGEYGKAEDLAHVWSLDKSDSTVAEGTDKRWPKMVLAGGIFLFLMFF